MSASSTPTRRPRPARATARLTVTEDFPTPPLPDATARTRVRVPRCAKGFGRTPARPGALVAPVLVELLEGEPHPRPGEGLREPALELVAPRVVPVRDAQRHLDPPAALAHRHERAEVAEAVEEDGVLDLGCGREAIVVVGGSHAHLPPRDGASGTLPR